MSSKNMKRVFMLLLAAAAMMAFPSVSHMFGMGKPAEKITSFKIVTLRLSGMRFTTEYEIVMKDKEAEVVEYAIRYEKNEDKRIPQRQMLCSADSSPSMPPSTVTGKYGRKARRISRNISGN